MRRPTGTKIADYAWLKRGRKYWNLWAGNPFCISLYLPSLGLSEVELIKKVKAGQAKEKKRFAKNFPDVAWEND